MRNLEHQPAESERSAPTRQLVASELFEDLKVDHYCPTVDGTKIHYTESGTGSRVIILGGLPLFVWEGFVGFIKPISANHIVNVFEYPGFGESQAFEDTKNNFENVSEILHKTIQQERLGPAHIVGLSFGGGVAIHLAANYPEDVTSLSLMGVPIEFGSLIRKVGLYFLKNPEIAKISEKAFENPRFWELIYSAYLISDTEPATKLYGLKWILRLAKKYAGNSPKAFRGYAYSILGTSEEKWKELAEQIKTPTAIVISAQEAEKEEKLQLKGPHATGIKLKSLMPHAQILVDPDIATRLGHGKGKPFAKVTLSFIEEVDES